jgi:hypothetical protein
MAVRVTSSGTIVWGNQELPIAAMKSEFDRQAQAFNSHGRKPFLVIEYYSNTPRDAIERLATVGRNAGFHEMSQQQLSWPDRERSDVPPNR